MTKIFSLKLRITPFVPRAGKSYIPLPKKLKNKGAIINPKNDDNLCFKHSIGIALNLEKLYPHPERITKKLLELEDELNWDGIDFDERVGIPQFKIFEKNNPDVKLIVRVIEPDTGLITKHFMSKDTARTKPADLFLSNDGNGSEHFSVMKNTVRFLRSQMDRNDGHLLLICDFCDNCFTTEGAKK